MLEVMKKILLIGFILAVMGACTQKLCPTYSKVVDTVDVVDVKVSRA
tara:strand:+ start:230 stop:370 length:141 start_codon:yes stop_codon:yes gene_type:complete